MTSFKNGEHEATYTYNPGNLRRTKTVDGKTTQYVWDGSEIAAEIDKDYDVIRNKYIYGLDRVLCEGAYSKNTYYQQNSHGDTITITDGNADTLVMYEYDAFGNQLNPDTEDTNPFRYCGQYLDNETGSYYLRARYYQPTYGRFLTADTHWNTDNMIYGDEGNHVSISDILQSNNLYNYSLNNPIIFYDYSGEIAFTLSIITAIKVISVVIGVAAAGYTAYKSYQYTGTIDWQATIMNGVSWGMAAYTLGMSAYAVYVNYCHYYGYTPVTEIKFNNTQSFLQDSANKVATSETGPVSGTKQHSEFKKLIDASNNQNLKTEVSFKDGKVVPYGTKGSVRLDVVEYDNSGQVVAAYDLKTGSAELTDARIAEIRKHVGISNLPVIEIKPNK